MIQVFKEANPIVIHRTRTKIWSANGDRVHRVMDNCVPCLNLIYKLVRIKGM